jgi:hypothetical protein
VVTRAKEGPGIVAEDAKVPHHRNRAGRCPGPEQRAASAELVALGQRVRRLDDVAGLAEVIADLTRIARSRCFALSMEDPKGIPSTSSRRALQAWWTRGGESWLRSYLEADEQLRFKNVVLPPEISPSIIPGDASETEVSPALAQLLCSPADSACGAEARGFWRRAELFFATRASGRFSDPCRDATSDKPRVDPCAKAVSAGGYKAWRRCLDGQRDRTADLPLGDTRAPKGGWVIIEREGDDREGLAPNCRRIRFFHVDSGSAYRTDSCPTDSKPTVVAGRVSTPVLRETLWMLLLEKYVRFRQRESQLMSLPPGLVPTLPIKAVGEGEIEEGVAGGCAFGVVHDTTLKWRWKGSRQADGEFRLASSPGGAYAESLLDVLNSGFEPVTPSQPLPHELLSWARETRPSR